jgi:hypothetical protein
VSGRRRPSALDRFDEYVRRRLSEGCRNRQSIRDELAVIGCRVGRTAVVDHVRRLESAMGLPTGSDRLLPATVASAEIPSAGRLAVASVTRVEDRKEADRQHRNASCSGDRAILEAIDLRGQFAALIRSRTPCQPARLAPSSGTVFLRRSAIVRPRASPR